MSHIALQQKPADNGYVSRAVGRMADKRVLITGGETVLARAIAIQFAREGADIALTCSLSDASAHDAVEATHAQIKALGRNFHSLRCDIAELDDCDNALEDTLDALGGIDILINAQASGDGSDGVMDTKTFAIVYLTRHALRFMNPGGAIINTVAGDDAMASFTRSLSQVVAKRGIRVNAVAPSAMKASEMPATAPAITATPDEIAPSYVFLASEDAGLMTGHILHPHGELA